jgi:hypothetical protein
VKETGEKAVIIFFAAVPASHARQRPYGLCDWNSPLLQFLGIESNAVKT